MKQNSSQESIFVEFQLPAMAADDGSESTKYFPYDRILRTLGSMLEPERFSEFELRITDDVYAVRGRACAGKSSSPSPFRQIFGLGHTGRSCGQPVMREVRYSISDLVIFETEVREQRKHASEMPDPYSLSQILRGVGCYLDKREGSRLVSVRVKNRWVTIEYVTSDEREEKAHQDFEYFYNYWVKMYLQRSNRAKLPPPSDPTLFVTWESRQRQHTLSRLPI